MAIMYVCADCYENASEMCAWLDRNELRVDPVTGDWLCEECYREGHYGDEARVGRAYADWSSLRAPPEYVPKNDEGQTKSEG